MEKKIKIVWFEDEVMKFDIEYPIKDIEDFKILNSFIFTKLNRLKKGLTINNKK